MSYQSIGNNIIKLNTILSTNNYAAKLVSQTKIPFGTVIMADYQSKGKGQRNSSWITPGTFIKIGESPFQAIAREFRENTGGQNIPFCFNGPNIFYKDLYKYSLRIYVCKSNVNKDQILQNFKTTFISLFVSKAK